MKISVRISRGGVTHVLRYNGMTLCGKSFHSGGKGNWDDEVTCKSCIKADARQFPAPVAPAVEVPVASSERSCATCGGRIMWGDCPRGHNTRALDVEALARAFMDVASNPDGAISHYRSQPYVAADLALLQGIAVAYPLLCASDVREIFIDCGESIKYCAEYLIDNGPLAHRVCRAEVGCQICKFNR